MTFAERFSQSKGKPIEHDGRLVQTVYRRSAKNGLKILLQWVGAIESPRQGISISIKGGWISVAGTKAKDVVLWRDTAPQEVTIECTGNGVREILIWNCWSDDRGVTHAWVGNAGMQWEEVERGRVRVMCNSRSLVTFRDLVFDLVSEDAEVREEEGR
jgi:hypothetical protein